jgi:uncharacterized protein
MPIREQSPFVIRLRDIPAQGQPFALVLTDLKGNWASVALGQTPLGWMADRLEVKATVHKSERDAIVVGHLEGDMSCDCSRCTGPAKVKLAAAFDLVFVPAGDARLASGTGENDRDEAGEIEIETGTECIAYHDEAIDLDPALREQLLLALPFAPLCRHDCKGLCPSCGVDRNEITCHCTNAQPSRTDHRWDALKNVKL